MISKDKGQPAEHSSVPEHDTSLLAEAELDLSSDLQRGVPGLVSLNQQLVPVAEHNLATILDIDGPVADPITKEVDLELIDHLVDRLEQGETISFNTGRSAEWVVNNVLSQLVERVEDSSQLSNLLLVCEMGTSWIEYDQTEGFVTHSKQDAVIPTALKEKAIEIVNSLEPAVMEFDFSKRTMLTLEFKSREAHDPKEEYEHFVQLKPAVSELLAKALEEQGLSDTFIVNPDRRAINIQHRESGKGLGARQIEEWLAKKGIRPKVITTIGDQVSDVAMAEYLHSRGFNTKHLHVGDSADFRGYTPGVDIETTELSFTAGTRQFFERRIPELAKLPATNADLLGTFTRDQTLIEGLAPWYDKVFSTAERIEVDHAAKTVFIHINPQHQPVVLNRDVGGSTGFPTISEVSSEGLSGAVAVSAESDSGKSVIGQSGSRILLSSGLILLSELNGQQQLLTIERGQNAPVAPGALQTAAGRCDKAPGATALLEAAEEHLLIGRTKGRSTIISLDSEPFISNSKLLSTALRGRENAIHEMELRIEGLRNGDVSRFDNPAINPGLSTPEQVARLQNGIEKLQQINAHHVAPISPSKEGEDSYKIVTVLGDDIIETLGRGFFVYRQDTNTLEVRMVAELDLSAYSEIDIYDGDGFGRNIAFRPAEFFRTTDSAIYFPTAAFLNSHFNLGWKELGYPELS